MDLNAISAGRLIDPTKEPLLARQYPTAAAVNELFMRVSCYDGALEGLKAANSVKEFRSMCPDCEHLKINNEMFQYLKASVYVDDTPGELVVQIDKILDKTGCGNSVIHLLPKSYIDKLQTFGYLRNGISLNGVITAVLGTPWYPSDTATIRADGVEYCVSPGEYVFVPIDVISKYPFPTWYVENGVLYLARGVPYRGYERKST